MPTVPFLGSYGDISGRGLMFRNVLVNGGFDIWQRGTSQTSSGYGSDDRWNNVHSGSTKTASRQTFTLGQTDVPGNPTYFARTVVTSSAGASNLVIKQHRVENVATLSGQMATLSFWAKADASKNIAIEFQQDFGTGGSPSAAVNSIGVTTCALTSAWKYFTVTVNIPSISGKVLGTDNNNNLQLNFWFDAGSSYNARTNSLGQQSGTFDIANVQLEAGPQATPFEQRPIGTELALCQRYCYVQSSTGTGGYRRFGFGHAGSTTAGYIIVPLPRMRAIVTAPTFSNASDFSLYDGINTFICTGMGSDTSLSTDCVQINATSSGLTVYRPYSLIANNNVNAKIVYSAEL